MANKNEIKLIVTADTKGAETSIKGFGAQLKSHWLELSAMAAGAFFTIRKIYTEFAAAAEREEKRMAFTNLAATFHSNADSIIADLKRMSGQSITTSRAIELAGKSMLSGLDPRAMPGLMEFAKTMSNVTGERPADTFEDMTRAIITGQARMLRMHGITVDFDKAQKDLATSLGGTKDQLNEQQIQYANLTALLETANTMTQRLGKDVEMMDDKIEANAAHLSDSYEKLGNSFWKTFGSPAIFMLEVFAERLDRIRTIAHAIAFPFQKAGEWMEGRKWEGYRISEKALPTTPAPTNELAGAHRGATSLKGLGFTFDEQLGPGLQSLKDFTEEMKGSLGELAKSEKDVTKEATNQIRDREAAYKNMYEALKFDTEKYYTFQKGLLEKQRQEEIAITGDLELAWEAYYARLEELEEQRILRTNDFAGGIKAYYAELSREGFTWAQGSKDMMNDFASGGTSAISGFAKSVETDFGNIGSHFKTFAQGMLDAWLNAVNQMIAQWLMFKAMTAIGNLLSAGMGGLSTVSGSTASGAGAWMGGAEGLTGIRGTGPAGPRRIPGSAGSFGGGDTVIVQQTIQIPVTAMNGRDAVQTLEAHATTIRKIVGGGMEKSRAFAKQMKGRGR